MKTRFAGGVLGLMLLSMEVPLSGADPEEIVFYPAYGFRQGNDWVIPLRAKVQEQRNVHATFERLFGELPVGETRDWERFQSRMAEFLADDESREDVRIQFDHDGERQTFGITDSKGRFLRTDANGIVQGKVTLPQKVPSACWPSRRRAAAG